MAATGSVSQLYSIFLEPLPLTLVSLFTLSKILLSITHRISLSLMALSIFSFPCRISLSLSGRYLSLCLWPVFIPYFPLLLSSNDPGQGSISYGIISRANNFPDEGGKRSHPTTPHASKLLQHVRTWSETFKICSRWVVRITFLFRMPFQWIIFLFIKECKELLL